MTTTFVKEDHPRTVKGKFETAPPKRAPQIELSLAGPSEVIRGASIGYSVTESHMSRAFVNVEDREVVAERLAAEERERHEAEGRDPDEYTSSTPAHWMTQFEAYDIFEAGAPAEFTDAQRQGFESVSIAKMNLDLDHQSFHYNAFTVSKNEVLAQSDGPYRRSANAAHQVRLTEFWDARADRLTAVREQLEELAAR